MAESRALSLLRHPATAALLWLAAGALSSQAHGFSDPTAPTNLHGAPQGAGQRGWDLSSTLVTNGRRVAVINGIPLREGERVGGARVVRISKSKVVLRTANRDITLYLFDASNGKRVRRP